MTGGHVFVRPGQVAPDRPAPDACMVCGEAVAAHGGGAVRLDRLDALSDWDRQLLLAYLDGRAPALVDEWFASRNGGAS